MTATIDPAPSTVTENLPSRLDIGGLVRSEWTKIRSLRSSVAALVLLVVLTVGFTALFLGLTVVSFGIILGNIYCIFYCFGARTCQ